jgi:peptidoglycan/LPS O-acetylase OafA/YrhL
MQGSRAAHLPGLDGLRGIATVMIAVGHAWFLGGMADLDHLGPLQSLVSGSWIAVDMFFILSAVILLAPVAAGRDFGRARDFYQRRVARIVPLYLLALFVSMLLVRYLRSGAPLPPSPKGLLLLLAHLLFVHDAAYGSSSTVGFGVDTPMWTLGVEMSFYLVLPWIARWWVRHPFVGLALGLLVTRVWSSVVLGAPLGAQQHLLLELPSYAGDFAAGMTLAVVLFHPRFHRVAAAARTASGPLKVAGTVWLLGFMLGAGHRGLAGDGHPYEHIFGTLPALPGLLMLYAGAVMGRSRVLDGRLARYLADSSYSVYLMHLPLIEIAVHLGAHADGADWPLLVLLTGPVLFAFLVARFVFRRVEVPARAWVNSLGRTPASSPQGHLVPALTAKVPVP